MGALAPLQATPPSSVTVAREKGARLTRLIYRRCFAWTVKQCAASGWVRRTLQRPPPVSNWSTNELQMPRNEHGGQLPPIAVREIDVIIPNSRGDVAQMRPSVEHSCPRPASAFLSSLYTECPPKHTFSCDLSVEDQFAPEEESSVISATLARFSLQHDAEV